jgi:ArsR family transcriptional regulator
MSVEQPPSRSQTADELLPTRLDALRALAEPMRLALVDELAREGACACDLRRRFDLSAPLLSHHLKVLREAGLVRCEKVGRRLEVELDREALASLAGSLPAGKQAA